MTLTKRNPGDVGEWLTCPYCSRSSPRFDRLRHRSFPHNTTCPLRARYARQRQRKAKLRGRPE
jgi:hypothetical protein